MPSWYNLYLFHKWEFEEMFKFQRCQDWSQTSEIQTDFTIGEPT